MRHFGWRVLFLNFPAKVFSEPTVGEFLVARTQSYSLIQPAVFKQKCQTDCEENSFEILSVETGHSGSVCKEKNENFQEETSFLNSFQLRLIWVIY